MILSLSSLDPQIIENAGFVSEKQPKVEIPRPDRKKRTRTVPKKRRLKHIDKHDAQIHQRYKQEHDETSNDETSNDETSNDEDGDELDKNEQPVYLMAITSNPATQLAKIEFIEYDKEIENLKQITSFHFHPYQINNKNYDPFPGRNGSNNLRIFPFPGVGLFASIFITSHHDLSQTQTEVPYFVVSIYKYDDNDDGELRWIRKMNIFLPTNGDEVDIDNIDMKWGGKAENDEPYYVMLQTSSRFIIMDVNDINIPVLDDDGGRGDERRPLEYVTVPRKPNQAFYWVDYSSFFISTMNKDDGRIYVNGYTIRAFCFVTQLAHPTFTFTTDNGSFLHGTPDGNLFIVQQGYLLYKITNVLGGREIVKAYDRESVLKYISNYDEESTLNTIDSHISITNPTIIFTSITPQLKTEVLVPVEQNKRLLNANAINFVYGTTEMIFYNSSSLFRLKDPTNITIHAKRDFEEHPLV